MTSAYNRSIVEIQLTQKIKHIHIIWIIWYAYKKFEHAPHHRFIFQLVVRVTQNGNKHDYVCVNIHFVVGVAASPKIVQLIFNIVFTNNKPRARTPPKLLWMCACVFVCAPQNLLANLFWGLHSFAQKVNETSLVNCLGCVCSTIWTHTGNIYVYTYI